MKRSFCGHRNWLVAFGLALLALPADATALTVTSTADAGGTCPGSNCTLRQAIATVAGGEPIDFALPPKSAITLTTAELSIATNLTITGPGADQLTVQRSADFDTPEFSIFRVESGNVTISGLTLANGKQGAAGGGISNSGTLTVSTCTLIGNDGGGG